MSQLIEPPLVQDPEGLPQEEINTWIAPKKGKHMSDKFVFIKHSLPGFYLFAVPKELELFAGDNVLCDTRHGQAHGVCICDSFTTEKGEIILNAAGVTRDRLRSIIGFVDGVVPRRHSEATIPEDINLPIDELLF